MTQLTALKKIIKNNTLHVFLNPIYTYRKNKIIRDYFGTNYSKKALLSYITTPFKTKNNFSHTNYFEAYSWANTLNELGYQVDIINYINSKEIKIEQYDVICGFGRVFQAYYESGLKKNIKTIYYGTGMHVCYQNQATLQRVKDVYRKKNVWLGRSARFVDKTWTHQTTLVDGIVALGNEICANSYRRHYDGEIYSIPGLYYQTLDPMKIIKSRKREADKHFLWFGSSGLIHKGLDLLLEFFSRNPAITLHICGKIKSEPDFIEAYHEELQHANIINHGFVDIRSDAFESILKQCNFVVFPSCSEGGCLSVINAIANGALIPVITKETTISTGHEIWIDDYNELNVEMAINKALSLNKKEIVEMQKKNLDYVLSTYSQDTYYKKIKNSIKDVLCVSEN